MAKEIRGGKAIEEAAEKARKAHVDAENRKKALREKAAEEVLANTPLTDEEKAFIAKTTPKLKEGRAIMQPSPAEILRYSKLVKRKNVKGEI